MKLIAMMKDETTFVQVQEELKKFPAIKLESNLDNLQTIVLQTVAGETKKVIADLLATNLFLAVEKDEFAEGQYFGTSGYR